MNCTRCLLPDTFPGVTFDPEGVCNQCQQFRGRKNRLPEDRQRYANRFSELLKQINLPALRSRRSYDVLMAYSGGKDSTYTMQLLKRKHDLRVLAVSLDNAFVSPAARENIGRVTDVLGVDLLIFRPRWDLLRKVFSCAAERELYPRKTLERASTICTSCIGVVKAFCLRTAIEQEIPLIGYGWSPGQAPIQSSIMRTNPSFARTAQETLLAPLRDAIGLEVEAWFLSERHFACAERFPHNVHPLAWEHYDEAQIFREIATLGWVAPNDTDPNSSNCLLNAFANEVHMKRYGFHPYVWEIANMVREGVMTREEGLQKFAEVVPAQTVTAVREKLGLT